MPQEDPEQLAGAPDNEADRLERHSDEVKERVEGAREDWERKRRDESVPGAPPPPPEEEDPPAGADENPPPEARREG